MQLRLAQIDRSEWKVGLYIMACQDGYIDESNLRIYYNPAIVDNVGLVMFLHRIFDHPNARFFYRRFKPKLLHVPVLAEALSTARWMMRCFKTKRISINRNASKMHGVTSASTKFVEILQADANISMFTAIVYHVVWSYYQSLECTELDHRVLVKRGIRIHIHYTHDWADLLDTMQVGRYGIITLHFHLVQLDMPLRAFVRNAPSELLPTQIRNRTRVPHPVDANSDVVDLNVSILPICKSALASRDETFDVTSMRLTLKDADSTECVVAILNGELHYSYSLRSAIPVQEHRLRRLLSFRNTN
jgi:hypothetical protein